MISLIRHLNELPKEMKYYALAKSALIAIGIIKMWWRITWSLMALLMVTPNGFSMVKDFPLELNLIKAIMMKVLTCVMILMDYFMIHCRSIPELAKLKIIKQDRKVGEAHAQSLSKILQRQ